MVGILEGQDLQVVPEGSSEYNRVLRMGSVNSSMKDRILVGLKQNAIVNNPKFIMFLNSGTMTAIKYGARVAQTVEMASPMFIALELGNVSSQVNVDAIGAWIEGKVEIPVNDIFKATRLGNRIGLMPLSEEGKFELAAPLEPIIMRANVPINNGSNIVFAGKEENGQGFLKIYMVEEENGKFTDTKVLAILEKNLQTNTYELMVMTHYIIRSTICLGLKIQMVH